MAPTPEETAREVLEAVPLVMRTVRAHMRGSRSPNLSVPQFRTLGFVYRHPGASLSEAAEHVGLTLPSMSKLIDSLVERKLVERKGNVNDRRRITLVITGKGGRLLKTTRESTQESLARRLSTLQKDDRSTVHQAMIVLRQLFSL